MIPTRPGKVFFIGAGPGEPDLITVKGRRILIEADLILYAGSLVPEELLSGIRPDAITKNSAGMPLEAQVELMVEAVKRGQCVARLHTGDPSIYGAIDEQMRALHQAGVSFEVIPGVSSALAAAAVLQIEYTLPEITQTVIFTRASGRTPVPELENLRDLARHHSSMVIFLSTGLIEKVVSELLAAGYTPETPIAVVYRCGWPDQKVVRGVLDDIASQLSYEELTHQGLIIISPALRSERSAPSHLYSGFQHPAPTRSGLAVLALTVPAIELARTIHHHTPDAQIFIPERFLHDEERNNPNFTGFHEAIRQVLQTAFQRYEALVCIMASGIVVREIAPLLKNKHSDPAVVVMDPEGKYAVSLLSGHEGGANRLARRLAKITGGQAVITTASDHQAIPALDILARENDWALEKNSQFAQVMSAMVNHEPVDLLLEEGISLPEEVMSFPWHHRFSTAQEVIKSGSTKFVAFTYRTTPAELWKSGLQAIVFHPSILTLGIGCNRGTSAEEIHAAVEIVFNQTGLARESINCVATITEKANEPGLLAYCQANRWKLIVFSHEQINQVVQIPTPSETVKKVLGVPGVAEPAALLASGAAALLVAKQKMTNVTVAVALKGETL